MRCGREHRRSGRFRQQLFDLRLRPEANIAVGACEVWKGLGDTLAGLAVGHDRRKLELRMTGEQAQQLSGNVTGAAEDDGRDLRAHCATFTPMASITRSPSAAPSVMALQAGTLSWFVMISTPTRLSVEGPVTTQGSIPKRSRRSFTPPHAATGSFADSTTPVNAARMSGHSRIASTP